jgi:tetratricopeptide (TPR) repeat protein
VFSSEADEGVTMPPARRHCRIGMLALLLGTRLLWGQGDFGKGISFYKQGQYDKAIAEFEVIVEEHSDYESGHRILGISYLKTDRADKAIESFKKALELKDDVYASHQGLGIAYYNTGNFQEAVAALEKAEPYVKSPADRYQLHHTRGSAYFNLAMYDRAISDLERAVSIRRGQFDDVFQLGLAHYRKRSYALAEGFLKQAVGLNPNSAEARNHLSRIVYYRGVASLEQGNYSEAVTILGEYLKEQPEDGDAWFNLGIAHLFSEHLLAAQEAFLKSRDIAPDRWETYNRLGYVQEMNDQYSEALEHYKKAHSLRQDGEIQASVERLQERIRRQKERR